MNERVPQTGGQTIEDGFGIGGFLGAALKQELLDDMLPVVALENELVFEKVDESPLVLFLA